MKIFPNGTLLYADGSQVDAPVFWGVIDPRYPEEWKKFNYLLTNIFFKFESFRNPDSLISLRGFLGDHIGTQEEISLELLQKLNRKKSI